ncbi:helix-turn-helix domain-containing protein [Pseudomonas lalucatii]
MAATGGNRARAAARLGISRAALYNKLALHRLG